MKTKILTAALLAAALAAGGAQSAAAATVYNATDGLVGNQGDFGGTLGLTFKVNSAVTVTALGAFDSGANGFKNTIHVTLFDSTGTALTTTHDFSGANPGGTAYVFQSIAPLLLNPGIYQVAAWGYGGDEPNFNQNVFSGPLTFDDLGGRLTDVNSAYNTNAGQPGVSVDGAGDRYGGPSFQATFDRGNPNSVPEPAAWALMIAGFGLAGAALRRCATVAV